MASNNRGEVNIRTTRKNGNNLISLSDKPVHPFFKLPHELRERAIYGEVAGRVRALQQRIAYNQSFLDTYNPYIRDIGSYLDSINRARSRNYGDPLTHEEALELHPQYKEIHENFKEYQRKFRNTEYLKREVELRKREITNWTADDKLNNLLFKIVYETPVTQEISRNSVLFVNDKPMLFLNPDKSVSILKKVELPESSNVGSSSGASSSGIYYEPNIISSGSDSD